MVQAAVVQQCERSLMRARILEALLFYPQALIQLAKLQLIKQRLSTYCDQQSQHGVEKQKHVVNLHEH